MKKTSLLWAIQHPDFVDTAYLFGTMHVQDRRAFVFNDVVLQKIAECTAFATEFNLEEAAQGLPAEIIQLPSNQSYSDYLTPKQLDKLKRVISQRTSVSITPFLQLRPLILIQMLTSQLLAKEEQFPLDEFLHREAKRQDKILLGLETFADQLEILKKLPLKVQFKSLVGLSRNFKQFQRQITKTTQAYESGDIHKIFKAAKRSARGMRHTLLYQRNDRMSATFFSEAQQHKLVAAVGAGHLGGKKGMLRLLKHSGCKISAIR